MAKKTPGETEIVRPRLFVGSSWEGRHIAAAIQDNLQVDAEVEVIVWTQAFTVGAVLIDQLIGQLMISDFGVFVFTPDDIVRIRGKQYSYARDNVVFELGLFIGKLGLGRSYFVTPKTEKASAFRILTDLGGVVFDTFEANRKDGSLRAALGPFCHKVAGLIDEHGTIDRPTPERVLLKNLNETTEDIRKLLSSRELFSPSPFPALPGQKSTSPRNSAKKKLRKPTKTKRTR